MAQQSNDLMDRLVALCKRRGFIFGSSEIYGGIGGFWDYGPLGVELKRNIKNAWWEDVVRKRDNIVGLDCSIIMNPRVWEASGHVGGFSDPMVDCEACNGRFRSDQINYLYLTSLPLPPSSEQKKPPFVFSGLDSFDEIYARNLKNIRKLVKKYAKNGAGDVPDNLSDWKAVYSSGTIFWTWLAETQILSGTFGKARAEFRPNIPCPNCGQSGHLTEPRQFNLMFKTHVGAMEDSSSAAYLRPETAQGIFANYKNVMDTTRLKLPFGIAQIGKAFRNEINPRNYTFRSREFEQMEIEFFCRPGEADKWYKYWRDARFQWYVDLGLGSGRLRLRDHETSELAHYAVACADIEYEFPFGFSELEGVANRTDFDLKQHQEFSGRDMSYFDDETSERFIPYVIEPSGGIDRTALAFLAEAYCEDEVPDDKGRMKPRTVMKFHPSLAPIKVAVFPLVKRESMPDIARGIYEDAKAAGLACFYDEKGAIGRRYRRQDEAGTPFCVTVDGQTLEDKTVTIRDRDSLVQERIAAEKVVEYVKERIG